MHTPRDLVLAAIEDDGRGDARLARDALHDPAAFTLLYQRYAPRVFWFLRGRTGSSEDAADLTQQVFLHCYQALPGYEDRGIPFSAWLFRIARNVAIDLRRRQRPAISLEEMGTSEAPVLGATGATAADQAGELAWLIAELPAEKRELIALRFGAGLSVAEIAAVLGKSEAAVGKQLQRLIRSLKEAYRDE